MDGESLQARIKKTSEILSVTCAVFTHVRENFNVSLAIKDFIVKVISKSMN